MSIPVGILFTCTIPGQRIKAVTCEKCGASFSYELIRYGLGKGSATFFVGKQSAVDRAAIAAERDLANRLERETELVPCPKCRWVNQELIDQYRRRKYRKTLFWIFLVFLTSPVVAAVIALGLSEAFGFDFGLVLYSILAVGITSPIWMLLLQRFLRLRINPNANYPQWPTVPLGTPPALVEQRDPKTGKMRLAPVADGEDPIVGKPERAVFRPGELRLPPVCCVCLVPTSLTYQMPQDVKGHGKIDGPICESCKSENSRKWRKVFYWVGVASLIGVGGLVAMIPDAILIGQVIGTLLISALITLFVGAYIAIRLYRPYRIAVVDGDRGIIRFIASNPGYTKMLSDQIRISEKQRPAAIHTEV